MGKINSRAKGARGEREWAKVCREHGYADVRRTVQYCGKTGDASDCVGLPGIHQEVKRTNCLQIYNAMDQAIRDAGKSGNIPIVCHRRDNCRWLVIMTAEDWFKLYREFELNREGEEDQVQIQKLREGAAGKA